MKPPRMEFRLSVIDHDGGKFCYQIKTVSIAEYQHKRLLSELPIQLLIPGSKLYQDLKIRGQQFVELCVREAGVHMNFNGIFVSRTKKDGKVQVKSWQVVPILPSANKRQ